MAVKNTMDLLNKSPQLSAFAPPTTAEDYTNTVQNLVNELTTKGVVDYIDGYKTRLENWFKTADTRSKELLKKICPSSEGDIKKFNQLLAEVSDEWYNLTGQGMLVEFLIGSSKESKKDYETGTKKINKILTDTLAMVNSDKDTIAKAYMDQFTFAFEKELNEDTSGAYYVMGLLNFIKFLSKERKNKRTSEQIKSDISGIKFNTQIMFRSTERLKESKKFKFDKDSGEIYVRPEMFTPDQRALFNKEVGRTIAKNLAAEGKSVGSRRPYTLATTTDDKSIEIQLTDASVKLAQKIETQGKNMLFNWSSTIDYHTHASFKELLGLKESDPTPSYSWFLKNNPYNYIPRVRKMIDKICSEVKDGALMRRIIEDEVLPKDPLVFFIGRDTKKMTGVLGEIAAMYMVHRLNEGSDTPVKPSFTANLIDQYGKQMHVDVLLNEVFGIQAKNSAELHPTLINFRKASARTILADPLLHGTGQVIGELEALRYFNIPYNRDEDGTYVAVDSVNNIIKRKPYEKAAVTYRLGYDLLKKQIPVIDEYLQMAAAVMMYLQVGENLTNNATDLFIIGTKMAITTAQIIDLLRQEYEANKTTKSPFNSKYFHIQTSLTNEEKDTYDNGNTIVDYFNYEGQHSRTKVARSVNKSFKSLSQYLERITLSSSFDFSGLIDKIKS